MSLQGPQKTHLLLLLIVLAVLIWSATGSREIHTWVLEVFPVMIAVPYLVLTYPRFQFTTLAYTLITMHTIIVMIGGHYTYAEVPLFNWLRDHYGLDRNYYDRVGHLAQGFVPAIIAREVLLRMTPLKRGPMFVFLVVSVCMAITAWYEILEFAVAKAIGDSADNFLGTQGDVWDTQWDMTFCLMGTIAALLLLSKWHDHQLRSVFPSEPGRRLAA